MFKNSWAEDDISQEKDKKGVGFEAYKTKVDEVWRQVVILN